MTTVKFLSPEWLVEVQKVVRGTIKPEAIDNATVAILTVFEKCPDGKEKALLTRIDKGVFTELALVTEPYAKTEFSITGDYATYMKVFKGQLDPTKALMGGDLSLKGNVFKAMSMVNVLAPFFTALGSVPAEF